MNTLTENNAVERRRGCQSQLLRPVSDHDTLDENSINFEPSSRFWNKIGGIFSYLEDNTTMNKSAKTALIAIAILVRFYGLLEFYF